MAEMRIILIPALNLLLIANDAYVYTAFPTPVAFYEENALSVSQNYGPGSNGYALGITK